VRQPLVVILALVTAVSVDASAGEGDLSLEFFLGTAANLETTLEVRQDDEPPIELRARYDTRALESPFYYAVRFGLRRGAGAWELQLVHHKLYLPGPPDPIQRFEITHGYNVLTLNRSFEVRTATIRIGAGVIIAHPESTVRGRRSDVEGILGSGYVLTGPALVLGAGKALKVSSRFFVAAEAQLIAARARVPVASGTADAPNVALHVLLGMGYRF
jgi:hypothetical protein